VNIHDQNRKHQEFLIQDIQWRIRRNLQRKLEAAQPGLDDAQRQIQAILNDLERQRQEADLNSQRKNQKKSPNHRRGQKLIYKLADKVKHKYEEDAKFRQRVDEGIEKMVAALINKYNRWKETAASDNVHPPSAEFSIVDYPVEVTWDDAKQYYRMVKDREQPRFPDL
jgi:hypothetical protein